MSAASKEIIHKRFEIKDTVNGFINAVNSVIKNNVFIRK
jgi:hypothetical protein